MPCPNYLKRELVAVDSRLVRRRHHPSIVDHRGDGPITDGLSGERPHGGKGGEIEGVALYARVRVLSDYVGGGFMASSDISGVFGFVIFTSHFSVEHYRGGRGTGGGGHGGGNGGWVGGCVE